MKRELNTLEDLKLLLQDRVDLWDNHHHKVSFFTFVSKPLVEVLELLGKGWYFYMRTD